MAMSSAEDVKRRFGHAIRRLREEKGLSQQDLGFQCGLDRTYIGGVERGERNISLVNICKITEALGVEPKDLFDGW